MKGLMLESISYSGSHYNGGKTMEFIFVVKVRKEGVKKYSRHLRMYISTELLGKN